MARPESPLVDFARIREWEFRWQRIVTGPCGEAPISTHAVIVVEDEPLVRGALTDLFASAGFDTLAFSSGDDLLAEPLPDAVSCLVVDVRLPKASGFDLQAQLRARGSEIPIVFMTRHGDISMSVRSMKGGAIDFFAKPFRDQDMLDAVSAALEQAKARRDVLAAMGIVHDRYASLTKREREVFRMVSVDLLNKQIANALQISEVPVKLHRENVMRKMQARTLVELGRTPEDLAWGTHYPTWCPGCVRALRSTERRSGCCIRR